MVPLAAHSEIFQAIFPTSCLTNTTGKLMMTQLLYMCKCFMLGTKKLICDRIISQVTIHSKGTFKKLDVFLNYMCTYIKKRSEIRSTTLKGGYRSCHLLTVAWLYKSCFRDFNSENPLKHFCKEPNADHTTKWLEEEDDESQA